MSKDRPDEQKGLKVLVDGEWHEASDEFKETVRSIDEGLKGRDRPDREKELVKILLHAESQGAHTIPRTKSLGELAREIKALFPDESEIIGKIKLTVETELALERDIIKQINEAKIEEAKCEEKERIRVWGNERCDNNEHSGYGLHQKRRHCIECWQALKEGK